MKRPGFHNLTESLDDLISSIEQDNEVSKYGVTEQQLVRLLYIFMNILHSLQGMASVATSGEQSITNVIDGKYTDFYIKHLWVAAATSLSHYKNDKVTNISVDQIKKFLSKYRNKIIQTAFKSINESFDDLINNIEKDNKYEKVLSYIKIPDVTPEMLDKMIIKWTKICRNFIKKRRDRKWMVSTTELRNRWSEALRQTMPRNIDSLHTIWKLQTIPLGVLLDLSGRKEDFLPVISDKKYIDYFD